MHSVQILEIAHSQLIRAFDGVVAKHPDRIQGKIFQILAKKHQLFQKVCRDGDDMATAIVCLDDVQKFTGARPQ